MMKKIASNDTMDKESQKNEKQNEEKNEGLETF